MKLEHVAGNLTCNISASNRANPWGCNYGTKPIKAKVLTVITDADNEVVFPANTDVSKAFTVPGFNALMSHILVFTNYEHPNYFEEGQELRVWYIEDLFNFKSESNNGGIHCINVYVTIQKKYLWIVIWKLVVRHLDVAKNGKFLVLFRSLIFVGREEFRKKYARVFVDLYFSCCIVDSALIQEKICIKEGPYPSIFYAVYKGNCYRHLLHCQKFVMVLVCENS